MSFSLLNGRPFLTNPKFEEFYNLHKHKALKKHDFHLTTQSSSSLSSLLSLTLSLIEFCPCIQFVNEKYFFPVYLGRRPARNTGGRPLRCPPLSGSLVAYPMNGDCEIGVPFQWTSMLCLPRDRCQTMSTFIKRTP